MLKKKERKSSYRTIFILQIDRIGYLEGIVIIIKYSLKGGALCRSPRGRESEGGDCYALQKSQCPK